MSYARTEERLSSNMEDYLEAIAALKKKKGLVRVRDIGRRLRVKTPSVTEALSNLCQEGFAVHERYGYVELTQKGQRLAQGVQDRHDVLVRFLVEILEVDSKIAAEDACRIEHSISPQTFAGLDRFIKGTGPKASKTKN